MQASSTIVYFRRPDVIFRLTVSDREYPVLAVSCGGDVVEGVIATSTHFSPTGSRKRSAKIGSSFGASSEPGAAQVRVALSACSSVRTR